MTGLGQYHLRYDPDTGECDFQGLFKPRATKVVAAKGDFLAIKTPGYSFSSGQGQSAYAPADFSIWHIVERDGDRLLVEQVLEFPTRG